LIEPTFGGDPLTGCGKTHESPSTRRTPSIFLGNIILRVLGVLGGEVFFSVLLKGPPYDGSSMVSVISVLELSALGVRLRQGYGETSPKLEERRRVLCGAIFFVRVSILYSDS
jgi:hypothetical protein